MSREEIPNVYLTSRGDGTRILVAIEPGLDDLLWVVDEAVRFGRTPPEGPKASCSASYRNGGEDGG